MTVTSEVAVELARWATGYTPCEEDLRLAESALQDTLAVGIAARHHKLVSLAATLPEEAAWAVACHVIDFDDLHLPSTTHISTICVPVSLALDDGSRAYLAGAGVMARLGVTLGWSHYSAGWHATATAGAIGAAATASVAMGLDERRTAHALALALPAAGGLQKSFGSDGKALQIGFASSAGVRAAYLAARGATADLRVIDEWLPLVNAGSASVDLTGSAVPSGLATKLYPCCYALQRPIGAMVEVARGAAGASARSGGSIEPGSVRRIVVRTPASAVTPLTHARPSTGLEGKFSLEYALAAALLDEYVDFSSFSDPSVQRPHAQRLLRLVALELSDEGANLLSGQVEVEVHTDKGVASAAMRFPPGSPENPPTAADLAAKLRACLKGTGLTRDDLSWETGSSVLRDQLPGPTPSSAAHAAGAHRQPIRSR